MTASSCGCKILEPCTDNSNLESMQHETGHVPTVDLHAPEEAARSSLKMVPVDETNAKGSQAIHVAVHAQPQQGNGKITNFFRRLGGNELDAEMTATTTPQQGIAAKFALAPKHEGILNVDDATKGSSQRAQS